MRIALITPYPPATRNGNAHTAARYARFLRARGHRVSLAVDWDGQAADAMIALHARRSYPSIARYAAAHPERRLVLVLTGTDLYRDLAVDADARRSLTLADTLVVLQADGLTALPAEQRGKARVIYQSAPARLCARRPRRHFDVCVAAHLRDEKDPFCAAHATALLPASSRLRVWHVGGELQPGLATVARRLEATHPRWRWLGALPHGRTRERIACAHLLVISSRLEGGANVIVEAVRSGTPVLASDIAGNRGMLGADYAGYFPVGDSRALAERLHRAETDPAWLARLTGQCAARSPLFEPAREAAAVQALLRQ